ncbi:hypothetical protein XI06_09275 [Bradyrhizobium sp. CCBAU 11434]|uniref:hypothetical protein n=1 Tax=Bradyrhizobium sp. CCBAU 11434 TaxID=1630885 RepID=UPI002305CD25|nr:hypothetical protein [Bradyrhizobium sp. CCBAU 11434]MDA9520551.1 hypothetical protein [Bradyrhizobium sp. CCBAU 11434]
MRSEPLLAIEPPAPVRNIGELYAIALTLTERAAQRYGKLAAASDEAFAPVRRVFEALSQREEERAEAIEKACIAAIGRAPAQADLRWMPMELVLAEELSDIENSLLSATYGAWALAVRHRERAFIFWTYIAARADIGIVRTAAESMAREALRDGNLLRRERRLAWRAERRDALAGDAPGATELSSAALLESLLLKDIFRWSQDAPAPQRRHLLSLIGDGSQMSEENDALPRAEAFDEIKRRALRRAEQLSSIYLDEADKAVDPSRLELAQQLAAHSIARLADLRTIASTPE